MKNNKDLYPDHASEINRINRIQGQLDGIKRMIANRRYCIDILTQTKAISRALRSLESTILERHINHCVKNAVSSKDDADSQQKINELVELFRKRMPA